jgi:hypothetical protein
LQAWNIIEFWGLSVVTSCLVFTPGEINSDPQYNSPIKEVVGMPPLGSGSVGIFLKATPSSGFLSNMRDNNSQGLGQVTQAYHWI